MIKIIKFNHVEFPHQKYVIKTNNNKNRITGVVCPPLLFCDVNGKGYQFVSYVFFMFVW